MAKPPAHRVIRRRDGAYVHIDRDARNVTPTFVRCAASLAPEGAALRPIRTRITGCCALRAGFPRATSVGLVEDPILIAALVVFEDALLAYLDTRP